MSASLVVDGAPRITKPATWSEIAPAKRLCPMSRGPLREALLSTRVPAGWVHQSAESDWPFTRVSCSMETPDSFESPATCRCIAFIMWPAAIQSYMVWRATPSCLDTAVTPPAISTAASTRFTFRRRPPFMAGNLSSRQVVGQRGAAPALCHMSFLPDI